MSSSSSSTSTDAAALAAGFRAFAMPAAGAAFFVEAGAAAEGLVLIAELLLPAA
jgi:hypothetical protein